MRSKLYVLILLSSLIALPLLAAEKSETKEAPAGGGSATARPDHGIEMPARGMSMRQVEKKFGKPLKVLPPTGPTSKLRPPITRWVYPDYIVYFERDLVIHSAKPRDAEKFRKLKETALPVTGSPP
ncbi:MAG TPA: hypothetical protein ENK48_07160 [Gammaproteobacteria bacterium]|nr:hypothetical protein [Gammaproteobacteria bacterium]